MEFALRSCCSRDPSILYQSSVRGESGLGASAAASSLLSTTREVLRVWGGSVRECFSAGWRQWRWLDCSSKMNQGVKVFMGTKMIHKEANSKQEGVQVQKVKGAEGREGGSEVGGGGRKR